jgi:streptogramin lyase
MQINNGNGRSSHANAFRVTAKAFWTTALLLVSCGSAVAQSGTFVELTEFPTPSGTGSNSSIAAGPHGALSFTEFAGNKIGRITTTSVITECPMPNREEA